MPDRKKNVKLETTAISYKKTDVSNLIFNFSSA